MRKPVNPTHAFSETEREALWRALRERRDMRHFLSDPLPAGMLERLVLAAHLGPSVGYMQPWRFIRLTRPDLRAAVCHLVEQERQATAAQLPSRNQDFLKIKVEGLRECAEVLAVVLMPQREAHIFGRRTMPDMDLASIGCAIQNMWLAARVEGIGLGWVSFFDPEALGSLLSLPEGAQPVALLCLGHVTEFYPRPMLESQGWGKRLELDAILFDNQWPSGAGGTPTAY